ncbi:PREDICTED: probable glucan endo-1,3-beta-glucosidase A6 [Ipomoea nil]|uniref:probable glucan endo-1,3-beta-glucosidase A6 n=1 Tax=Ipomoea nil TaxID=35883 RepID=UPI0009019E5B|nr:PREDICTED: probable glucan endo-1,3-beta-glucosidase A6 [Ipomoea nil]
MDSQQQSSPNTYINVDCEVNMPGDRPVSPKPSEQAENLESQKRGADIPAKVGICYGQLGNNLPTPSQYAELIHGLKAKRVKIYDANLKILRALGNSDVQVSVMVPNEIIPNISFDQALADRWVETNVVSFYSETKIRYLLVGNEIFSNPLNTTWFQLVPAMRKIRRFIKKFGLRKIKVGTPLAMDMLEASYPPSSGAFLSDIIVSVFKRLLQFLDRTNSFFFFDVYPYFAWAAQPTVINLNYLASSTKLILQIERKAKVEPGSNVSKPGQHQLGERIEKTILPLRF